MVEIFNVDYNNHVNMIGTAHFTRRSINDAYESIKSLKPKDIALELDLRRFKSLNTACVACPRYGLCKGLCEFTGAAYALGNVNANIWLIDMTEREMGIRMRSRMTPSERTHIGFPMYRHASEDPVWLWERGFKDRVIENSKKQIEALREIYPSIWQVLIDERNTLMAARLAWIVSKNLQQEKKTNLLTFVGAAHVEGIRTLLSTPLLIKENLRKFGLPFTKPTLVRRVNVQVS